MNFQEKVFMDKIGVYPVEIKVTIWKNKKQAEFFVIKKGNKRNSVSNFVLQDEELDNFIKFISQAGGKK